MTAIRAGVAGVGRLGAAHARLLARSGAFSLVGVHDRSAPRAAAVAGELEVEAFAELPALCERCEAVVIAVPTSAHHAAALTALRAGCHVLVEKPVASTLQEADDIVALAAELGRTLGVGHVERFNGALLAAEPWLKRPRYIESQRMAPFQPRGSDVTVILDLMIHDIDLVLALTEAPLSEVRAVGVPVISRRIDLANARLSFEDGTVANITASRVSPRQHRSLRLFQRSGYFSLDLTRGTGRYDRRRGGGPGQVGRGDGDGLGRRSVADSGRRGRAATSRPVDLGPGPQAEPGAGGMAAGIERLVESIPLDGPPGDALERELDAFAGAIRGRPGRLATGEEGREALDVATRITREIQEFVDVVAQSP